MLPAYTSIHVTWLRQARSRSYTDGKYVRVRFRRLYDHLPILSIVSKLFAMSDRFLAGPSAACCLRGTIHTGDPSGAISEFAGV
jgi:hypothetical protein